MSSTIVPGFALVRSLPRRIGAAIVVTTAVLVTLSFLSASSLLLWQSLRHRHDIIHRVEASAAQASGLLDQEVFAASSLLTGLASSPAIRNRDLPAAYDQLIRTAMPGGAWIALWDLQGQLLNTATPLGAALPRVADYPGYEGALAQMRNDRTTVSNRVRSQVKGTEVIAVNLRTDGPDGTMNGFLSLMIPDARLSDLMDEQRLPPGWSSTLLDRKLRHVVTSGAGQRMYGEIPAALTAEVASRIGGTLKTEDVTGSPALAAIHRSRSGYTALTTAPLAAINEPVFVALRQIGLGALALLIVGGLTGRSLARRVGEPMAELAHAAARSRGALRLSEARHDSFWQHTPESLFTVEVTANDRFVFAGINPAHERLTGLSNSQIVGREPHECLPSEAAQMVTRRYRECVRCGEALTYDETLELPGGVRYWRTSLAPVRDPAHGRITLLFGSARDVTQDLRAKAELASLNERLTSILSSVSDCCVTFDREFRMTGANPAALDWLGLSEEAAVGASFADVYAGPHECARVTRWVMKERVPAHVEVASGLMPGRWLDYHVYPSPEGVSVFFRDITEAKTARSAVEEISRQLLAAQEEERRRIAAELHDSTAQHLVSAGLNLMQLPDGGEAARRVRKEVEASLDEALKEIRIFTYLLHPPGLRSDGLGPTLQSFVEGFAHRAGLSASFHASPALSTLRDDVQRSILRVVQEALANTHRHANASQVAVNAKLIRGALFVRIRDDGRGMTEPSEQGGGGETPKLGVGIPGMRARLRQFGGDLTIRSRRGRTTVMAVVPRPT